MAKRTYKITKGQQYDQDGAQVTYGRHDSLTARYRHDGSFDCGEPPRTLDTEEIVHAVLTVIRTGVPLNLVLGEDDPQGNISVGDIKRHLDRMDRMMDSGSSVY